MLRYLISIILPFLIPFIIFGFYLWTQKVKAEREGHGESPGWAGAPWGKLIIAGVALMAASLLFWRFYVEELPQERGEPLRKGDPTEMPSE